MNMTCVSEGKVVHENKLSQMMTVHDSDNRILFMKISYLVSLMHVILVSRKISNLKFLHYMVSVSYLYHTLNSSKVAYFHGIYCHTYSIH